MCIQIFNRIPTSRRMESEKWTWSGKNAGSSFVFIIWLYFHNFTMFTIRFQALRSQGKIMEVWPKNMKNQINKLKPLWVSQHVSCWRLYFKCAFFKLGSSSSIFESGPICIQLVMLPNDLLRDSGCFWMLIFCKWYKKLDFWILVCSFGGV